MNIPVGARYPNPFYVKPPSPIPGTSAMAELRSSQRCASIASMQPEKIFTASLRFAVKDYGSFLATRPSARSARNDLEAEIERERQDCLVVISFHGVDAMTISFADEFLGRFYSALSFGDIRVTGALIEGMNSETRETVSICLERRDLVAAAVENDQGDLVGGAEFLRQTYAKSATLGTFRASELSAALGITHQNANNRLKRLVEAGAVHRRRLALSDRGGKEFVYTALPVGAGRVVR